MKENDNLLRYSNPMRLKLAILLVSRQLLCLTCLNRGLDCNESVTHCSQHDIYNEILP